MHLPRSIRQWRGRNRRPRHSDTAPRTPVRVSLSLPASFAIEWWLGGPLRASSAGLHVTRLVGGAIYSSHPMWLWAAMFTLFAGWLAFSQRDTNPRSAGVALLSTSGLFCVYGVLTGYSAILDNRAPFSGLIYGVFVSYVLARLAYLCLRAKRWE